MVKDLLGLAHQYAFPELEQAVSDYLKSILSLSNVCLVYDVANLYQLRSLMEACRQFADRQAAEILQSEAFLQLSPVSILFNFRFQTQNLHFIFIQQGTLCDLLRRDSFCVAEVEIFRAVQRWWQFNSHFTESSSDIPAASTSETTDELGGVLQAVRLPLISLSELLNEVRPSNLVSADAILDALKLRTESRDSDLPYRGQLSMLFLLVMFDICSSPY